MQHLSDDMWRSFIIAVSMVAAIAANSEMSFTCDFESDTCGFTNQEGLDIYWERREMDLDGKQGYMMVIETNTSTTSLGKMITPYFEMDEELPGCLSFDLYVTGVRNFAVQQERNFGIMSVWIRSKNAGKGWQKPRIDVDVDESTRFFFEVVLDGAEEGALAAVDNLRLDLKKC